MRPAPRSQPRRALVYAALGALLVAASLTLTQCRLVDDRLTGVDVLRNKPGACVSQCSAAANLELKAESELHVANVKACADDPVCLALEEARHEAAVAAIQAKRKACMEACFHQGGGGTN